jgi:hypothetical protein
MRSLRIDTRGCDGLGVGSGGCSAASEYEAVRSSAKRFLVARGHELPEVERVVEDNERFCIVEKTMETEFMAETDPRSPSEGR